MQIKQATKTQRHEEEGFSQSQGALRVFVSLWLIPLGVLCLLGVGCRQDMHDQPKYIPLRESTFFDDARSARPIVPGTVARGQLRDDVLLYTGKVNGANGSTGLVDGLLGVMLRGQANGPVQPKQS